MLSIQELLPQLEFLEGGERRAVEPLPCPYSVVSVEAPTSEGEPRWSSSARFVRVAWVSMTVAEQTQALCGSESILVGPGEDLEAARWAFSLERAGELLEAHPAGTVALLDGSLPPMDAASEHLANVLLEALCRARSAEASLVGVVEHPCPELFAGWIRPGERSAWSRAANRLFCYANADGAILRLEAYEIPPGQHDRVVSLAVAQFKRGFPRPLRPA